MAVSLKTYPDLPLWDVCNPGEAPDFEVADAPPDAGEGDATSLPAQSDVVQQALKQTEPNLAFTPWRRREECDPFVEQEWVS